MTTASEPREKATSDRCRDLLLRAIAHQGGEWTPSRVARLYSRHNLTHVYRATIRRHLKQLHADGVLLRHSSAGRVYYTPAGGAQ